MRAALVAALMVVATGCGGTLEGKYRRGELTSTTTAPRPPATTPGTVREGPAPPPSSTTSTTAATSGNAGRRRGGGEAEGREPGGSIVGSATRRAVGQTLGGRHR